MGRTGAGSSCLSLLSSPFRMRKQAMCATRASMLWSKPRFRFLRSNSFGGPAAAWTRCSVMLSSHFTRSSMGRVFSMLTLIFSQRCIAMSSEAFSAEISVRSVTLEIEYFHHRNVLIGSMYLKKNVWLNFEERLHWRWDLFPNWARYEHNFKTLLSKRSTRSV